MYRAIKVIKKSKFIDTKTRFTRFHWYNAIKIRPFLTKNTKMSFSNIKSTENSSPNSDKIEDLSENEKIVIHEGEIKDSAQIFELVWNNLKQIKGDKNMIFPKGIYYNCILITFSY